MAETRTPEQVAYDDELARIQTLRSGSLERIKAKETFDAKYPNGRPTGTLSTNANSKSNVDVRTKYGIGEALINHPIYGAEIKKIFALLDAGKLAEAEDEYFKSAWGKLDTDAQNRILMQLENDKLYKEKLKNWMAQVS